MITSSYEKKSRKIIHIDMDCFYAAIEMRDHPELADKPIAVGGSPDQRGVICTCNYLARQYGVHSAMATATAYRLCRDLIVLPVNMPKYRAVAATIHAIFHEFTDLVEPLALDEAYLDVTGIALCQGSATLMAQAIRKRIWDKQHLTASAGVATNKFLAKIASGWNKPNGLLVIEPHQVQTFIKTLPVNKLFGVGKVTAEKLHNLQITTCTDLQKFSLLELTRLFGKLGERLYEQCRGQDQRPVEANKIRKSLSVEQTFVHDLTEPTICLTMLDELFAKLTARIQDNAANLIIKNQYIKIKFADFKLATAEISSANLDVTHYLTLFHKLFAEHNKAIRLLGLGVHFRDETAAETFLQHSLF